MFSPLLASNEFHCVQRVFLYTFETSDVPPTTCKTSLLRGELNCRTFEICPWFRISAVVWFLLWALCSSNPLSHVKQREAIQSRPQRRHPAYTPTLRRLLGLYLRPNVNVHLAMNGSIPNVLLPLRRWSGTTSRAFSNAKLLTLAKSLNRSR